MNTICFTISFRNPGSKRCSKCLYRFRCISPHPYPLNDSNYLDLLTSHLYDYLRPRIIHENDIITLSELCNVFLMYVMQDENDLGKSNPMYNQEQELMYWMGSAGYHG